jgi:hypothetical protein
MWLFEAFISAFWFVLLDSDETRIAPQAICVPLPASGAQTQTGKQSILKVL